LLGALYVEARPLTSTDSKDIPVCNNRGLLPPGYLMQSVSNNKVNLSSPVSPMWRLQWSNRYLLVLLVSMLVTVIVRYM